MPPSSSARRLLKARQYVQIAYMLHVSEKTIAKVEKGEEIAGYLIDFGAIRDT
jgi:predicted transcriptional regulator